MPSIPGVRSRGLILDGLAALPAATSMLVVDSAGVMAAQALPVPYSGATTNVDLGDNSLTCGQVNLYDAEQDLYVDLLVSDGVLCFGNDVILSSGNISGYAIPFTGATSDVNLNGHSLTTRKVIAQATAAADIVGLFKGTTSQTGDLIECQDVTAAVVAKTTADGSQHARQFIPGGGSSSNPLIFAFATAAYSSQTTTGTGISLYPTAIPVNGIGIALAGNALAGTSGNYFHVNEAITFAPTSGTATFSGIRLVPTINQTGGASGITRGLIVSPSITAAADWRSIETSNDTGWAFYGAGLAPSMFGGNITAPSHTLGTSVSAPRIYTHNGHSTALTNNATGLTLYGPAGAANNEIRFQHYTNNSSLTAGFFVNTRLQTGVAPTSGTGTVTQLQIDPTINQTGGASGITRGVHVMPTLTAAADWRSIETNNNTGYAFYGAGTAPSQFGGNVVSSALMCAGAYTVGTLPSASANAGKFCQVTDSSVTTFGSTVAGGGSNRRQVFSDGTNWIID